MGDSELRKNIEALVAKYKQRKPVLKALDRNGIDYTDLTEEMGCADIHILTEDGGYIRIYKPYKKPGLVVGKHIPVELRWSGIPVFEPSGRHSF